MGSGPTTNGADIADTPESTQNETENEMDFWISPDSTGECGDAKDEKYDELTSNLDPKALVRAAGIEPNMLLNPLSMRLMLQCAQENPHAMAALANAIIPEDLRRIGFHKTMPQEIVERLRNTYTCFEFYPDETQCNANSHDLAAVPRRAYNKMCAYDVGALLDISDVEGNEILSATRQTRVHYCRIVLDGKDAARVTTRNIALQKLERERPGVVDMFRPGGPRVCTRGVENCTVRSPVCCEIHVYDITMEQQATYFENKDVSLCITVFN